MEKKGNPNAFATTDDKTLFTRADRIRAEYFGDSVHLRGIIEFSNICSKNCMYCGLRAGNKKLRRYRMSPAEILDTAEKTRGTHVKTIVLQSGEDILYDIRALCRIIEKIKIKSEMAVTVAIGERSFPEYRMLKESGADRYLLKFETSDEKLFSIMKPDSSYGNRMSCLENLFKLGFETGSGNLVGLPGQDNTIIAGDIELISRMNLAMVSISPFIPHPDSPLSFENPGDLQLTLKTLALTRLAVPHANIPATTAIGTLDKQGREKALSCGANVIMPNITPVRYKKDYLIYKNKICISETPEQSIHNVLELLKRVNRQPV